MMPDEPTRPELVAEVEELRARLAEAEAGLRAIRTGNVDGVVVTGERGEQVYTLRGANSIYRTPIETMSEGAVTLSAEGVILYGNLRMAEILGRPLDQVLGTALRDDLPQDDQPALGAILTEASTELSRREICVKTGAGRVVPVYLSTSRMQSDAGQMVFCLVLTDLTEHKRHEHVIATERLARFILKQAVEAIVVCDEQGRVTRVSRAAEWIFDGRALPQPFADVLPLRTHAADPFDLSPVLQGETLRNVDVVLDRHGGQWALILNAGPLFSGQQILGCVVTLTDITTRKRTEEKVNSQLEELTRWHGVMLNREDRVQLLKREVNELCGAVGKVARYPSQDDGSAEADAMRLTP